MSWNVALSVTDIISWKYGGGMQNNCAMSGATLSLLVAADGSVFLTIGDTIGRELVILNFARYYFNATFGRWTNTMLTFQDGANGLFLHFATASSMERFEQCCDRVLPTPLEASGLPPTLQQLGDLGIITLPRIIGDFSPEAPPPSAANAELEVERPISPSTSSIDSLPSYNSDELAEAYADLGSAVDSDVDEGDGDLESEVDEADGASLSELSEEDSASESEFDEFEGTSLDSDYWNPPLDYDWFAINVDI